jgi:ABC-type uncharacterized transport system auxiliary subunit
MTLRFGILALTVALAACSSAPSQPQRFFRLTAAPAETRAEFPATINIGAVEAYGVAAERPLLYRASADSRALEQYHYSLWSEPPPIMLRDALVGHLRAAFGADRVLAVDTRLRPEYRVRTRLKRLEQILARNAPRAALGLEFTVTGAQDEVLFVLDFSEEATAAGNSVEDHVAALEGLMARACHELERRLVQAAAAAATVGSQ